jgi:sulfur carrier protein
MELKVNGNSLVLPAESVLASVLERLDITAATGGVAIALNDTVVPRQRWKHTVLNPGDSIEVIHAVQGG